MRILCRIFGHHWKGNVFIGGGMDQTETRKDHCTRCPEWRITVDDVEVTGAERESMNDEINAGIRAIMWLLDGEADE